GGRSRSPSTTRRIGRGDRKGDRFWKALATPSKPRSSKDRPPLGDPARPIGGSRRPSEPRPPRRLPDGSGGGHPPPRHTRPVLRSGRRASGTGASPAGDPVLSRGQELAPWPARPGRAP